MNERERATVIALAVVSLCPVLAGIAYFPTPTTLGALNPECPVSSTPWPGSVAITPQSPDLLPKLSQYNASGGGIGFQLNAPADFSGSWGANSPIDLVLLNLNFVSCNLGPARVPRLNGTFNLSLFPGNYVVQLTWPNSVPAPLITATQPWVAEFDRGLDLLQVPEQFTLASGSHLAWALAAPNNASRFFLQGAIATNSCDFEFAVLPPAAYRAFASGQGPLNGTGADLIAQSNGGCGPGANEEVSWPGYGPLDWASGDVAVLYNAANYAAEFNVYAALEVSYLTG